MEKVTYQEILIVHSSKYFSKEFMEREALPNAKRLSHKEQLAEACWNGLLKEALPEICTKLRMQQINEGNKFLNICFGENEEPASTVFSVNPYFFLNHSRKN